jgi:tetratricopeptide (TPR) repeat protein
MLRDAEVEVQLETPLMGLVRLVGAPGSAQPEAVSRACQHIAAWADAEGHSATSIAFAQAAAAALPGDASTAFAVGRTARRRAEYARAETWFRRAIALARQSGDWTSYALAFSGLGNLYVQRGNYPAARRFHVRALRAARRHSLRQIQGSALHDLFVISAAGGSSGEAERMARGAFEAYGAEHPRLSILAHDIAYLWMEQGHFGPALTVFEALLPHLRRHEDRMVGLANIVRASAGAGDRRRFDEAWDEVWDGLARNENTGTRRRCCWSWPTAPRTSASSSAPSAPPTAPPAWRATEARPRCSSRRGGGGVGTALARGPHPHGAPRRTPPPPRTRTPSPPTSRARCTHRWCPAEPLRPSPGLAP